MLTSYSKKNHSAQGTSGIHGWKEETQSDVVLQRNQGRRRHHRPDDRNQHVPNGDAALVRGSLPDDARRGRPQRLGDLCSARLLHRIQARGQENVTAGARSVPGTPPHPFPTGGGDGNEDPDHGGDPARCEADALLQPRQEQDTGRARCVLCVMGQQGARYKKNRHTNYVRRLSS